MINCRLDYWVMTTNSIHDNTYRGTSYRSVLLCGFTSLRDAILQHTLRLGPAVGLLRHIHAINALKLGEIVYSEAVLQQWPPLEGRPINVLLFVV